MVKKIKYQYVFWREAIRTAICESMKNHWEGEKRIERSILSSARKLEPNQYIKFPVDIYATKECYLLVDNGEVFFASKIKNKKAEDQLLFDFKHFNVLYNSLIPAYRKDNVGLRKIVKGYPSIIKFSIELITRDIYEKVAFKKEKKA